jgi:hypothetical protein
MLQLRPKGARRAHPPDSMLSGWRELPWKLERLACWIFQPEEFPNLAAPQQWNWKVRYSLQPPVEWPEQEFLQKYWQQPVLFQRWLEALTLERVRLVREPSEQEPGAWQS